MIYIKNTTETQTVFIPRNELQKEAYITSTKTYEDGYREGLEDGKEYQKDQLLNLYVTENGQYEREDGWGTVTVDIPIGECPDCPEGGSCNLGEGEVYLTTNDAGFYELYAADDGYDGWSKFYVTLENSGAIKIHKASDLLDIFNNGEQIDFGTYYYVGGEITEIQEINTEFGNATYVLDNGFKIYRGDWLDGNPFGVDQIKVGAYIVVYGIIQDYRGELQLKAHSQVIAYQECEGGEIVSCNLEDKGVNPSINDRDGNGVIVITPSENYDGLLRVVLDPTTIYNEGVSAGKAEGSDLNIDAVSTSLGAGNWTKWTRNAAEYGLDGMSEITIDGSQYQEWTKALTLLQAYQNTEETYITENGEYRANIGYDGYALNGYNVGWVIDVIPTIDTDVEIWVKPYDGAPNNWQGFIGSQVSDEDNTTFQIRKMDGNNAFSFRFGEQSFDYWFEYYMWYRLRMNRNGVWVNGEQVCGWDVQAFEENPNPLMINGIYNLGFENENYRMNFASYGYVYFHNTDSLLVPFNNGLFIGNKNQTIGRPAADGAALRAERNWYPKGYTKVTVDVPQNGGGSGDCNLINPIIFSESEGDTINAESVQIPTFVYEGNQYYNIGVLYMADYEEFKIQIRFQPTNGGYEDPVNIFGCEDTDWDDTTFGARIYMGNIYFRMSGLDIAFLYSDNAWYDVEMGYNSSKRWITVNGETILETDHAFVNKPSQNFMIGAINSGGNAFRPFYGRIATIYLEANGNQVWLLPKEEGHMDVYWNDRTSPWIAISGENNARFEKEFISGDGMKSITWLGKRVSCPSAQEQVNEYYYNPITVADSGFGERAKEFSVLDETMISNDEGILYGDKYIYVPSSTNRNEIRTKVNVDRMTFPFEESDSMYMGKIWIEDGVGAINFNGLYFNNLYYFETPLGCGEIKLTNCTLSSLNTLVIKASGAISYDFRGTIFKDGGVLKVSANLTNAEEIRAALGSGWTITIE